MALLDRVAVPLVAFLSDPALLGFDPLESCLDHHIPVPFHDAQGVEPSLLDPSAVAFLVGSGVVFL